MEEKVKNNEKPTNIKQTTNIQQKMAKKEP